MKPIFACILLTCCVGCNAPQPASVSVADVVPAIKTQPAAPTSLWEVHKSVNQLDGKTVAWVGNSSMVVRCSPKFEGYVTPPLTNLGHRLETSDDRDQRVRFKIDGGSVRSGTWDVSTSFDSLFIPAQTLRQIIHGKSQLMYEYEPEYVVRETTSVDLTGLSEALAAAGCRV